MNRTQQLNLLNDEIRRLFSEGVSEQNIFEQLQVDTRFDSIRRSSIQSLYKKLQKDADKEAQKRQLEERKRKVGEQKRQFDDEQKQMVQYRQNAKEFLICEDSIHNDRDRFMGIWQNRYYVTLKADCQGNNTHVLKFYDLLQNISKEVSFQSADRFEEIRFLSSNCIVFIESNLLSKFFRLVQINLVDSTLQFVQNIEFRDILNLFVDSSNPSKFLLLRRSQNETYSVVVCKLVNGNIEIGEEIALENLNLSRTFASYFNDQLLVFTNIWRIDMSNTSIIVQNVDLEKNRKTLKIKSLPSSVYAYDMIEKWVGKHFFISIRFRSTDEYGFVFTDSQTCSWTILQFATSVPIEKLSVVNKCDLLVFAKDRRTGHSQVNIHKLSMHKPEFLRYKAWVKLVMLFKKRQVVDPYDEARKFLPLTSDIRGSFAADQDDE